MSQSLVQDYLHIIFSTKNRVNFVRPEIRADLCSYIGGTLRNLESPGLGIGCVSDHVHILCSHSKNMTLVKLLQEIKTESSKWVKNKGRGIFQFLLAERLWCVFGKCIESRERETVY